MSGNSNPTPDKFDSCKVNQSSQERKPVDIPDGADLNYATDTRHQDVLYKLLQQVQKVDFSKLAGLKDEDGEKVSKRHYVVYTVEHVLRLARDHNWDMCINHKQVYLFNGAYWKVIEEQELKQFLGRAAEKMGVERSQARYCDFRKKLLDQFMETGYLPKPEGKDGYVLVNFKNGTYEISPEGRQLRKFRREDFLTYQLPFEYNPLATAPLFQAYLDQVLPDKDCQKVLAEYLGYVFVSPSMLKIEKCLLLYGSGANGKSVFFEIVRALLGSENASSYSLQNLTKHDSYQRAQLENKLVNYASEINGKLETDIFKQLVSGEPVEARQIYGIPFTMTKYAKLIFNCNELPKEVEHSYAYFRRFLIVPFEVTIPEAKQDKTLAKKIIDKELSGVFNWVMEGLERVLQLERFTESEAIRKQVDDYKRTSDNVQMFLSEYCYEPVIEHTTLLKVMYDEYKSYCFENGNRPCANQKFSDRLKAVGYESKRANAGTVVYAKRNLSL